MLKAIIALNLTIGLLKLASGFSFGTDGGIAEFQLHNRDSGTDILASVQVDTNVTEDDVSDFASQFDSSKDTKILIHGWLTNQKQAFANALISAYLNNSDCNVIFVNWSPEAVDLYSKSVEAVPKIGRVVARMIDVLVQNHSASLDKIHIVGHSLGAHIAGIAGLYINSTGQVARITGLDPAHPKFNLTMTDRLRNDSATFVDVIHTCTNLLSFSDALGHVDFYPNGGKAVQPGCLLGDLIGGVCSHARSYLFFAESITSPTNFKAIECDEYDDYETLCESNDTAYMGEHVSTSATGTFYLKTNKKSPYGQSADSDSDSDSDSE